MPCWDEYKLPFIAPEMAAPLAAAAEHVFPLLIPTGVGALLGERILKW